MCLILISSFVVVRQRMSRWYAHSDAYDVSMLTDLWSCTCLLLISSFVVLRERISRSYGHSDACVKNTMI
jgi:hypothetical protein